MDEMEYANAIADEAREFNVVNVSVGEFDEAMADAEARLRGAIATGRTAEAKRQADNLRAAIIDNGYADSDELPHA